MLLDTLGFALREKTKHYDRVVASQLSQTIPFPLPFDRTTS